jgi:hypothetical protein
MPGMELRQKMQHENTKTGKRRLSFFRLFVLSCSLSYVLFAFGCGLADYQEKFARRQERVNYMDQENEYLGKPIQLPRKKEGDSNPSVSVFFRPPLGISTSPDDKPVGVLSHYHKVGSSKTSSAKADGIQDLYLAVAINRSWPDFKNDVLASFKSSEGKAGNETLSAPGREPLTFETFSFTEGAEPMLSYRFYFFRDEIYRVAIGFAGPQSAMSSESTQQAIKFSLGSLVVGESQKK